MKLSTFGLGLAVAASSLVGVSSLSQSADAASVGAKNGSFTFEGTWEFTFLYSFGSYKSAFGISPSPTLFTELTTSSPGTSLNVAPNSPVFYTFIGSEKDFFLNTTDPLAVPTILSSTAHSGGASAGFWIASGIGDYPATATTTVDDNGNGATFAYFVDTYAGNGVRVIGVNDSASDSDFNDFIVKAKPVPVPAIVPGIALAAAFFGSKALKRSKKEASESVA